MATTTKKQPKPIKSKPPVNIAIKNQGRGFSPRASLGARLSISVIMSAVVGLGALAIFYYQGQVSSTKRVIEEKLNAKANEIEAKLSPIKQTVADLAASTRLLSALGVKDPNTYKTIVFEHIKTTDLALAVGVAQAPFRLVPARKLFFPYVYKQQKDADVSSQKLGQQLPAPNDDYYYSDLADLYGGNSITQQGAYTEQLAAKKTVWIEPYVFSNFTMTTYVSPFYDAQDQPLGVAIVDLNVTTLAERVSDKVLDEVGYYAILSEKGNLLAYPPNVALAKDLKSYKTIPEIGAVWEQIIKGQSGLVESQGNFWAYRRIPSTNWLIIATVPQSGILGPVAWSTLIATLLVGGLLLVVVGWFIAALNRRLKPILDECNKLAEAKGGAIETSNKDEIERLSASFFNLIDQIAENEEKIREEVARTVQAKERLNQAQESEQEAEFLETEVGGLLDVVSAMEDGDLTVQAEVSDRATGLVADTLNRLREQLAEIIARVLGTAQQVVKGAEGLEELARTVALNTVDQAQSVAEGQALTEQVALSAKNSVAQVNIANQSLLAVQQTVAQGQVAINTLTEGITVLQKGTAQIVQRMKTLGEFVGLAEQFVQDQGQIASLTQVLAINATLVAARAAEQRDPKQFIGVAREFEAIAGQVNTLATQTNEGLGVLQQRTAQIQSVVSAIDAEVQNLGGLVAGFNSGVEQSQNSFYSIQSVTEEVVEVGRGVNESSLEIATAADSTAKYMSEIAILAEQTADLTRNARQQAEQMGTLAQRLLAGIQFFRLPASLVAEADNVTTVDVSTNGAVSN